MGLGRALKTFTKLKSFEGSPKYDGNVPFSVILVGLYHIEAERYVPPGVLESSADASTLGNPAAGVLGIKRRYSI